MTRTVKIDLTGSSDAPAAPVFGDPAETVKVTSFSAKSGGLKSGITLDELTETYHMIIKSRAIYYPVAYQFVRELGRGHQGTVFLGDRQGARGCVTKHAIKIFDPSIYRNPEEYWTDMGRIASQISQLHGVQSPNLVMRHSYDETYGIGYTQMEAIDGMDIRSLLNKQHLDMFKDMNASDEWDRFSRTVFDIDGERVAFRPGLVVYVLRRVLRGLDRLHSMNFLHCDIKPANVMIDRLGNVKLVDFGRAVIAGEKLSFLLGAPLYMAPETHLGKKVGIQSDLFSVGLLALEMLTGEPLTDNDEISTEELVAMKMEVADELSSLLPASVKKHRNLVRTIRRLVQPYPEDRYESAKEAEVGDDGLKVIDKQFAQSSRAVEYDLEFSDYLSRLVDRRTDRIEVPEEQ